MMTTALCRRSTGVLSSSGMVRYDRKHSVGLTMNTCHVKHVYGGYIQYVDISLHEKAEQRWEQC